jgi:hypothetical protein
MKQLEHRGGVVIEFEDLRFATTPLPLCGCSSDESTKTSLAQCIPTDSGCGGGSGALLLRHVGEAR